MTEQWQSAPFEEGAPKTTPIPRPHNTDSLPKTYPKNDSRHKNNYDKEGDKDSKCRCNGVK